MEKILAIVFLIVFIWLAIPHLAQGQWIAPTPIDPNSWIDHSQYTNTYTEQASVPSTGFGWFHFDFWNHPSSEGIAATSADLHFQKI